MKQQLLCSCIYCKEVKSVKGIHTHVERSHFGSNNYSSGHNGKYNDSAYRAKIKENLNKSHSLKLGKFTKFSVNCDKCKELFSVTEREFQFPLKEKYFCSRSCSNSRNVTEEHKRKTSSTLSGKIYKTPEEITKNCIYCNASFTYTKHYTQRDKKYCGRSCSSTHVGIERTKKARLQRSDLTNYRADCAFKFSLNDYPSEFDFALVTTYGWYKAKNRGNNQTGVSRDHAVSVRYGFDNNLPSEHLAHPANCILMQHNKNVSKGIKNTFSYEDLLIKIKEWDKKYPLHQVFGD